MKGYFSRLIQQTGITFGSASDSGPGALKQPLTMAGEHDVVTPIHIDEERLISPPQGHMDGKASESAKKNAEGSIQDPEKENKQQPREERFQIEISEELQDHIPEKEKPGQQKQEPEEKNMVIDKGIQSSLKRVNPQQEIDAGELLEREETVEIDIVSGDYAQQLDTPVASTSKEHKNVPDFTPDRKLDEQKSQVQHQQVYLKEVREWVAVKSDMDDNDTGKGDGNIIINDTKRKVPSLMGKREKLADSSSEPTASQQRSEPEIHDYHLSIGTISLTIEEPQKDVQIQSKEPPKISGDRNSKQESNSSRLSRHYIRVR